jgi:hypothetical protein
LQRCRALRGEGQEAFDQARPGAGVAYKNEKDLTRKCH